MYVNKQHLRSKTNNLDIYIYIYISIIGDGKHRSPGLRLIFNICLHLVKITISLRFHSNSYLKTKKTKRFHSIY
jgi:hypothetical protein